jgi:putative endonuclease
MDRVGSIADRLRPCAKRWVPPFESPQALGAYGEKVAASFLKTEHSYKTLVTNYRVRRGELDLVCRHGDTLVFVEVKSRASEDYGRPEEAVTREKRRRMQRAIEEYLREIGRPKVPIRVDVVEVILPPGGKPECRLLRDITLDSK